MSRSRLLDLDGSYRVQRRRRLSWVAFLTACVAVIILCSMAIARTDHTWRASGARPTGVAVPALAGRTLKQARALLGKANLRVVDVRTVVDARAPAGTVVRTDPAVGTTLQHGDEVRLTVSSGPKMIAVPPVAGAGTDAVVRLLLAAHLQVGRIRSGNSPWPQGVVADAVPRPGTKVAESSRVDIVVATGRVAVPDVRFRPSDEAVQRLRTSGLGVTVVAQRTSGVPAGMVTAIAPTAGTVVPVGTTVSVGVE